MSQEDLQTTSSSWKVFPSKHFPPLLCSGYWDDNFNREQTEISWF